MWHRLEIVAGLSVRSLVAGLVFPTIPIQHLLTSSHELSCSIQAETRCNRIG